MRKFLLVTHGTGFAQGEKQRFWQWWCEQVGEQSYDCTTFYLEQKPALAVALTVHKKGPGAT